MSTTLKDVVDQLKVNNRNVDELVDHIKQSRLDGLEAKLKAQRERPTTSSPQRSAAFRAGESAGSFSFMGMPNPSKLLAPLLAGVTAFGAGLVGLRGWEKGAIASIGKGLTSLTTSALDGAKGLRTSILGKMFGIEVDAKTGLAKSGDTTKKGLAIYRPLSAVIEERFASLRTGFLNAFGIGADGKPIQDPRNKMKVSTTGEFITKATARITRLLNPIIKVSTGIADFIKGAGSGLFKFLDPFISGAKSFTKLFGKILWPVGVIMSLFESVTAYQNEDGSKFDKFKAGFGTFFADFIGAPLDLLKNGMVWILKNLFGLESDENGKIKPGQGLTGDALAIIQKFSYRETIKGLIDGIFAIGEAAFKWFGDLFSGEKSIGESMSILWKGFLGAYADIASWVWNKAIAPITEWFASKLGIDLDLPELNIREMVGNTYERIKNGFMASMENLAIWFMTMPKKIGMSLEEEWIYAVAKLKTGFVEFGNWVSTLPNKILLNALESIASNPYTGWMVPESALNAQRNAISNKSSGMSASLERIDYSTAQQLGDLNSRRRDLENYEQQLLDARTYNNTTVNSGGIVMDATTPTTDPLGGGSAYAFVGGR